MTDSVGKNFVLRFHDHGLEQDFATHRFQRLLSTFRLCSIALFVGVMFGFHIMWIDSDSYACVDDKVRTTQRAIWTLLLCGAVSSFVLTSVHIHRWWVIFSPFNLELLSNFEGFFRRETKDGRFSLRDHVFQEFAKPAILVIMFFF